VAQRIGQVFLQRSAVNLLSSVLDTPEFFWSAPDHLQVRLLCPFAFNRAWVHLTDGLYVYTRVVLQRNSHL
jgi:hypothetical protein